MKVFETERMRVELYLPGAVLPTDLVRAPLIHGARVVDLDCEELSECDGLVTTNRNTRIGIRTADCAPLCFSDGKRIGVAHVGWRGLCAGLIEAMRTRFRNDATVYVAPFLHSFTIQRDDCYEKIIAKFGERFLWAEAGQLTFNFKDAIVSLLPGNTHFDERRTGMTGFPSYRLERTKERFVTAASFP